MAFTGAAVVEQITDRCCRITGVSLALGASGVIGLHGSGLEVALPDAFNPQPYKYGANSVSLSDMIRVEVNRVSAPPATAVPLRIVKTEPAGVFTLTLTNDDGAAASGSLEIYVFWD